MRPAKVDHESARHHAEEQHAGCEVDYSCVVISCSSLHCRGYLHDRLWGFTRKALDSAHQILTAYCRGLADDNRHVLSGPATSFWDPQIQIVVPRTHGNRAAARHASVPTTQSQILVGDTMNHHLTLVATRRHHHQSDCNRNQRAEHYHLPPWRHASDPLSSVDHGLGFEAYPQVQYSPGILYSSSRTKNKRTHIQRPLWILVARKLPFHRRKAAGHMRL